MIERELLAHVRALIADPRFARNFHQPIDLRDVTNVQFTAASIREAVRLNPFGAGARRAVVVTNDVVFGMARMYQILADESPDEVQIFRKMDYGLQWLGIADAKAELLSALSQAPPIPGLD
ncbi:MAG: hypothetical protein EHM80_09390 [Nitrospiraceae bacterium]|nr:MAG: hypothetical protein EHM80_09390 [Nitrospiraceae bacterium]